MLCCYILQGFAFDYTDENGVTWSCEINEDDQNTVSVECNNNNDNNIEIMVPETIKYSGKAYTVTTIKRLYSKAITVKLPENIKTIGNAAFYGCWNLVNINLSNITTIEENAFFDCQSLRNLNLSNVEIIGNNAFGQCHITGKVEFSDKIHQIENYYTNADTIIIHATEAPILSSKFNPKTYIFVPQIALNSYRKADVWKNSAQIFAIGGKTDYEIKTNALDDAPGILQKLDKDSLNSIVSLKVSGTINSYDIMLFRNKMDNLHYLDLSEATIVTNPYEYYTGYSSQDNTIGEYTFHNQDKLISVKLPVNLKQICTQAFSYCRNLKEVTFPNNIFFKFEGQNIFCGCSSLEEIALPNGLEVVPYGCFQACGNLKRIIFPPSLKRIESVAFSYCI